MYDFNRLYELAEGYGTTNTPLQDSLFHAHLSDFVVVFNGARGTKALALLAEIKIACSVYPAIAKYLQIKE